MIPTMPPEPGASGLVTAPPAKANSQGSARGWLVLWSGFVFAFLQSVCTAVIAVSGIRVLIGLSALASANWFALPARLHADWIRIPMMLFALVGSLLNLYVVRRIRRLRGRSAARWRAQPVSADKARSELLQISLAVLTLVLLAAEETSHIILHRLP